MKEIHVKPCGQFCLHLTWHSWSPSWFNVKISTLSWFSTHFSELPWAPSPFPHMNVGEPWTSYLPTPLMASSRPMTSHSSFWLLTPESKPPAFPLSYRLIYYSAFSLISPPDLWQASQIWHTKLLIFISVSALLPVSPMSVKDAASLG